MKTIFNILLSGSALLLSASCSKWLDVMPQGMTTEENLFSDYSGYRSALNGIYQQMSSASLYGRELSWGFTSALAQYYDFGSMSSSQLYTYTEKLDYENKEVLDYLENIWQTAYNTIANCNALIAHVSEADPEIFPYSESGEREMIYGEALAARALMHFEVLRLFAAAPVVDRTSKAIPYSTSYPDRVPTRYTTEEVLAKIVADLEAALPLLEINDRNLDALKSASTRFISNDSRGLFFGYRGTRLHYWAVKALLARVYMYACDYEKALETATEVYETCSEWFPITTKTQAQAITGAVKLYDDIIFAAYDQYLKKNYNDVMLSSLGSTSNFILALRQPKDRFSGETSYDTRYMYTINQPDEEQQEDLYASCKYVKYTSSTGSDYDQEDTQGALIPVLRMSEVILIMAECKARGASGQGDGDISAAVSDLNLVHKVRCSGRKTVSASNYTEFMEKLDFEMWKENIGEGQYFFFLKRLNSPTLVSTTQTIQMAGKYVFDIPDSETTLK
ncbi:MAG TPA: RagB/SusD family nutrient uptake outer membrane protein [Candidatus Alistipes intestinigallinarum]|uniref:RagB/SusD family nutrient uptake outer membrane protein n=1 Tax=Candidatus Alistipes intestinigallinarum TaxID=2838440 RepID=A0A9D2CC44_9BACT|nr:RagB/SusD family nutrient uptake outer membrane protein [Candidatus Alistipes intestinigallinarum]